MCEQSEKFIVRAVIDGDESGWGLREWAAVAGGPLQKQILRQSQRCKISYGIHRL